MPLIIDANRACDFKAPASNHAPEIVKKVTENKIAVAVGGKLLRELALTHIRDLLVEWRRSGRLKTFPDSDVDKEEEQFKKRKLKSDDPHILALAVVSGARLLYTEDNLLIKDFKNKDFLNPKGKIISPTTTKKVCVSLFGQHGI